MSSEEKENIDTYYLYNMALSKIKMANMQYGEDSKEVCELAILGTLAEIYNVKDVYERVLSYLRENELYERYLKAILELQFNPPKMQESQSQSGNSEGEEGRDKGENGEYKKDTKQSKSGGGVSTKADKFKELSQDFINDMFRIDDSDL